MTDQNQHQKPCHVHIVGWPPHVGGDDDPVEKWFGECCACGWKSKRFSYQQGAYDEMNAHMFEQAKRLVEQLQSARDAEHQALLAHASEKQAKHNVEAGLRGLKEQLEAAQRKAALNMKRADANHHLREELEAERDWLKEQVETLQREFDRIASLNEALAHAKEQLEAARNHQELLRRILESLQLQRNRLLEQLEARDAALRTILDLTTGWTRPMADDDRKELIERVATAALNPTSSSDASRPVSGEPSLLLQGSKEPLGSVASEYRGVDYHSGEASESGDPAESSGAEDEQKPPASSPASRPDASKGNTNA